MGYFDTILAGARPETRDIMKMGVENIERGQQSARSARIAEIEKELAEIRRQKAGFDTEGEMGKYKFVYDGDPSIYMNYKQGLRTAEQTERQNIRNAEQTEKIRKATEDATKASNAQTAWKQNSIDLEAAKYDLASARNAYSAARANGDETGMRKAELDLKIAQAKLNRLGKEQSQLRNKFAKELGLTDDAEENALDSISNVQTGIDLEGDISRVNKIKTLKGRLTPLGRDYDKPRYSIPQAQRDQMYYYGVKEVAKLENDVNESDLDEATKQELLSKLDELKRKVELWKPGSKDPNRPSVTMTKADYEKALTGLNPTQILAKGSKWLANAKNAGIKTIIDDKGVEHDISDLIKAANAQGKK